MCRVTPTSAPSDAHTIDLMGSESNRMIENPDRCPDTFEISLTKCDPQPLP